MAKKEGCRREDCIYRSENCGWFVSCDYLLMTGDVRGCPIENCTKYTPGERKHKWTNNDYWFARKEKK